MKKNTKVQLHCTKAVKTKISFDCKIMLNIKKLAQLFFGNGCEQTYGIFTDAEFVTNRAKPPRTYKLMSFSLYMPNIENY